MSDVIPFRPPQEHGLLGAKDGRDIRIACDPAMDLRLHWIAAVLRDRLGVNASLSLIVRVAVSQLVEHLSAHLGELGRDQHRETSRIQLEIERGRHARRLGVPMERALAVPLRGLHAVAQEWAREQPHYTDDDEEFMLWHASQFPPGNGPKPRWKVTPAPRIVRNTPHADERQDDEQCQ